MYAVLVKTTNRKLILLSQFTIENILPSDQTDAENSTTLGVRLQAAIDDDPERSIWALSHEMSIRPTMNVKSLLRRLSNLKQTISMALPCNGITSYVREACTILKLKDIAEFHIVPYYHVRILEEKTTQNEKYFEDVVDYTDDFNDDHDCVHVMLDTDFNILAVFHDTEYIQFRIPGTNEISDLIKIADNGFDVHQISMLGSTFVDSWAAIRHRHAQAMVVVGGNHLDVNHIHRLITVYPTVD